MMGRNFSSFCAGGALFLAGACAAPGSSFTPGGAPAGAPAPRLPIAGQPGWQQAPAGAARATSHLHFVGDSLVRFFRPDAHIILAQLLGDTLLLAATSDFVYYPFGHCPNIACAQVRYAPFVFTAQPPPSRAAVPLKLYRGTYQRSQLVLSLQAKDPSPRGEGPHHPELEVAAGSIQDVGPKLANGIAVGQSLAQVLAHFFRQPLALVGPSAIKVVRLDSGLDRIRHSYTFSQGRLTAITFQER